MNKEIAGCYKFYDIRKNRIAAFCREIDGGIQEIFLLKCNKTDQFSKKLAKQIYMLHKEGMPLDINGEVYHPNIVTVKPINGDGTLRTLLKFLTLNFYIGVQEFTMQPTFNLYNGINKKVVKSYTNI